MTPEYVRLRMDMTVEQAFAAIRKQGENAETVYTCYVVESNRLQGVVSARNLLLADPKTPITERDRWRTSGAVKVTRRSGVCGP